MVQSKGLQRAVAVHAARPRVERKRNCTETRLERQLREAVQNTVHSLFSRMRSEGFPFIVGGLGVGAAFAWLASCRRLSSFVVVCRRLSSSLVVSRRLSSCVVVVASQICCHWGKFLQVNLHGCVTCQLAPLFHCDLQDHDMSRKKRDAFCEIRSVPRSSIEISVWRVVFLGCWMWPCHWDLRFRVWHRSSVFVTSLS